MPKKLKDQQNMSTEFINDVNKSLDSGELVLESAASDQNNQLANSFIQESAAKQERIDKVDSLLNGLQENKVEKEIPPICPLKRNKCGLLEGIEYKYREDGFIDWRSMIKPEYLFLNSSNKDKIEKKYGKKFYEIDISEDKVQDVDLLIGLAGLKELLRLRGYKSVTFKNDYISYDMVSKTCTIKYIGNYETGGEFNSQTFESCADATTQNVFSWYSKYLTTAAENRALARNIRNFLNIHICSKEEIGADTKEEDHTDSQNLSPVGPHAILAKKLEEKNTSFEKVKEGCIKRKFEGAEKWNSILDIPKSDVLKILDGIKLKEVVNH